jgi:hypothetical protein
MKNSYRISDGVAEVSRSLKRHKHCSRGDYIKTDLKEAGYKHKHS